MLLSYIIHVGFGDLKKKKMHADLDIILNNFKQLIWKLLESTKIKICISLIIPVPGCPELNKMIHLLNAGISDLITEVRSQSNFNERIFTYGNDSIAGYIQRSVDKHGILLSLDRRGENKLWLRLRDIIMQVLEIPSSSQRRRSSSPSNNSVDHD